MMFRWHEAVSFACECCYYVLLLYHHCFHNVPMDGDDDAKDE